jgi:hypothetical protein
MSLQLVSIGNDPKTVKGEKKGYLTGILYQAPCRLARTGVDNCPHATKGCKKGCLYRAGRGQFTSTQKARVRRTRWFHRNRKTFLLTLDREIGALERKASALNMSACFRPNGTSDLAWEKFAKSLIAKRPGVQWYDYTKNPVRMRKFLRGEFPTNYHLTLSRSETNDDACVKCLKMGGNVAVVFRGKELPATWKGFPVVDGDEDDLRFLNLKGVVVGLKAKGPARNDRTGFVVD